MSLPDNDYEASSGDEVDEYDDSYQNQMEYMGCLERTLKIAIVVVMVLVSLAALALIVFRNGIPGVQ